MTGLNINKKKTQVMDINNANNIPISIDNEKLETVENSTYVGSLISKDNGARQDTQARLNKACVSFSRLTLV